MNLTDNFGTGVGPLMFQWENLEEIIPKFEGRPRDMDTKLCHMGKELDPNFSKSSNYLG